MSGMAIMVKKQVVRIGREVKQMVKMPLRLHRIRRCRVARWSSLSAAVIMLAGQLIPVSLHAEAAPKRIINWNQGLKEGLTQTTTPELRAKIDRKQAELRKQPDVRKLTRAEMKQIRGSGPYRNKYFQGVLPWQRSLRDVNLCNGNLFKSFTDVQVAPAKGAGLALQRTYNSQDDRVGPFGTGWTHAYDIRMVDENSGVVTDESLNLADRADFFGGEHKYHRDADGLYTPPAYLFDELSSGYDNFLVNGPIAVLDDTERSTDGTVKHFIKGASGTTNPERVCDTITDRYGNQTVLSYTDVSMGGSVTRKLLNTVTDPSGRTLTFTWTNFGTVNAPAYRITAVQGPLYSVAYSYYTNANDPASYLNLASVTLDPAGLARTTTFTYASYAGTSGTETGLLTSISDPLSHTVSYGYTLPANVTGTLWVTSISEPGSGGAHTYSITAANQGGTYPISATATPNSGPPVYVLTDAYLRKHWMQVAGGSYMFQNDYDTANNVTFARIGGDYWPTGGYVTSCPTSQTTMEYGPHGNVLSSYPTGYSSQATTTTYYNASQYFQKASVTDPLGRTTTFGVGFDYDPIVGNRGSVLWVRDAGYGVSGNPSFGKQFSYTYNQYGQKLSETNLNNVVTNYTYGDQWGNLTQVVQDPGTGHLARTTSMVYNAGGQVTSSTDPMGRQSTFQYNLLGQPTQASFPSTSSTPAESVSYTYGGNGRMSSVTDNRGTTNLSYETGNDRVSSVSDPVTGTVGYTYTLSGERASMSLPGGGTWTYTYNGLKPMPKDDPNAASLGLSRITDDQGRVCDYILDTAGKLHEAYSNQSFDSGGNLVSCQWMTNTFDGVHNWLTETKNTWKVKNQYSQWVSTVLTQNDYTYNYAGMRLTNAISDSTGLVRTEQYGYDEQTRLTSVNYGDSHSQTYTFDAMGNRATKVNDGTSESYTYNNANMLLTRGANSYTNDLNGNTLTGGGRTNTWDSQNRLYQCVNGSTTTVNTYASDGIRHRTASTVSGTTTTRDFVLDDGMFVREQAPVNGVETNVATYLVGLRGPEYRRDDSSGAIRWYCYDGLGSVLGEVNNTGVLTATRSYDVYGGVRTSAGTSTSKHKFVGDLGHTSEDETGLIYMRARYMDPVIGRFVSQDPAKQGLNWFIFADSDPINNIDPDGCHKISNDFIVLLVLLAFKRLNSASLTPEVVKRLVSCIDNILITLKIVNQLNAVILASKSGSADPREMVTGRDVAIASAGSYIAAITASLAVLQIVALLMIAAGDDTRGIPIL